MSLSMVWRLAERRKTTGTLLEHMPKHGRDAVAAAPPMKFKEALADYLRSSLSLKAERRRRTCAESKKKVP